MQDPMVRSYIRSDNPRMHWTDDLDIRFIQVIEKLGGEESKRFSFHIAKL